MIRRASISDKTSYGFDFPPLAAPSSTEKLGDFSEDCLNEVSSAAPPYAALRPKEISGSGVAFFLDTFSWLRKKKCVASRVKWFKRQSA